MFIGSRKADALLSQPVCQQVVSDRRPSLGAVVLSHLSLQSAENFLKRHAASGDGADTGPVLETSLRHESYHS